MPANKGDLIVCKGCEEPKLWPFDFPKCGFNSRGHQRWRLDLCRDCWRFSNRRRALLRKSLEKKMKELQDAS